MCNENNSHLDTIVKDGVVRIPSIFMFEDWVDIDLFLVRAKQMNCLVIFENEDIVVDPKNNESSMKIGIYRTIIANKDIVNSYLRYLGNIEEMSWDKVEYT